MSLFPTNILAFLFFLVILSACQKLTEYKDEALIHELNKALTNTIVLDGFSPPVASRIYAYSNLAFYESLVPFSKDIQSFSGQLNEFNLPVLSGDIRTLNYEVVGIYSFCAVAKKMVYRDYLIDSIQTELLKPYNLNSKKQALCSSYAAQIITAIEQRMKADNYNYTRTLGFYEANLSGEGTWVPTPPTYNEAIEPNWAKILPFFLDSAQQFKPAAPLAYSSEENSDFYAAAYHVYETVNTINEEDLDKARFWDCNPMVSVNNGHVMHLKRQLTPGGHWVGIAGTAAKIDSLDLFKTAEVYTNLSIVIADAFISCWEAKYRTNLIRPETYINNYIDVSWRPILETPMFPEYTSGHSVVSAAAAEYLTGYFGDNFAYLDSINVPFNLPSRNFDSFYAAANEAAQSRLLGGIHYMQAIEEGKKQGFSIGKFYLQNIHSHEF
jgi:hypothetical protein